jgi:hypothetical protein
MCRSTDVRIGTGAKHVSSPPGFPPPSFGLLQIGPFMREPKDRLLEHAIDWPPRADSLEREFAQELRPHAARAHKFSGEQGRALEILAHRLDARSQIDGGPNSIDGFIYSDMCSLI